MLEALTVSVEEAGRLLGISRGLAYELVRRGGVPSVRLGRRLVVPRRALEAMLEVGPGREQAPLPAASKRPSAPRRTQGALNDVTLPFSG